jgi:hypothetical protein
MFYGEREDLTFVERLELMRDNFGIINKTPDSRGFNGMVTNLRMIMERNGSSTPDIIVVPPYVVGFYYFTNDDLWQYQSAGPAVAQNRANASDIGGNGPFRAQTIQGLRIVDTHVYRPVRGARTSANDLLTVPVQIGEFYPMCVNQFYRDVKSFENFRSSHRDIEIFNEEQGRFVTVYFLDAVRNSYRWKFDENGEPTDLDDDLYKNVTSDIFYNRGICKQWKDVSSQHLSDDSILRLVSSVKGNLFSREEWSVDDDDDNIKNFVATLRHVFGDGLTDDNATDLSRNPNQYFNILYGHEPEAHEADRSKIFRQGGHRAVMLVAAAFLLSDISFPQIKEIHEADVYVPVNTILARPWMTYYASTVIIMKAGRETGETIIGHPDFQMSANTQTSELEAKMTYYAKAIVSNPGNVMVAPHVFIQSYISGNNVDWLTWETLQNEFKEESAPTRYSKESLISMLVPATNKVFEHAWIDYRGSNNEVAGVLFHESVDYYRNVFEVTESDIWSPLESFIDYEAQTFPSNTICWSGHYNYGPEFKFQSLCQGHLGDITYNNINNSRKEGKYTPIKTLHFNVSQV